jgi:hypothetical protein
MAAATTIFVYYTTWAIIVVRVLAHRRRANSHIYVAILRRIKPNSRVVPATRMGHPPSCFRSGCWAVCYRSIYWVYYYQRESEAGAEGQATGGMTPQFASTVFHVQYSRLLLNKQLRPSPTRIVYARTRHLNAYLTSKLTFAGFPHERTLTF